MKRIAMLGTAAALAMASFAPAAQAATSGDRASCPIHAQIISLFFPTC